MWLVRIVPRHVCYHGFPVMGAHGSFAVLSQVLAESWEHSRVPSYLEKVALRSAPIDVCFEDSLLPPLLLLLERAG